LGRVAEIINGGKKLKKKKPKVPAKRWEWEEAINALAEFYHLQWKEVQRWNILYFMYKSDFIKHEAAKADKKKKPVFRKR
jgi:hypothetical protein